MSLGRYSMKKGFIVRKVGGENIAVPVGERGKSFHGMIKLNETGNFLWEFFEVTSASQLYEDGLQEIIRLLDRWDKKPAKRSTSRFIWVLWKQYLCPLLRPQERADEYLTGLANKAAHTRLETPDFDALTPEERYKIIEALKKRIRQNGGEVP